MSSIADRHRRCLPLPTHTTRLGEQERKALTDTITRNLLTISEDDTDLVELENSTAEIVRNLATIAEAKEE